MTMQAPQQPQQPQQPGPHTLEGLLSRIATEANILEKNEEGGYEPAMFPMLAKAFWFAGPWATDADTRFSIFQQFETNPLKPGTAVLVMFEDEKEIRVYALQVMTDPKSPPKEAIPPSCYHLSKAVRVYTIHSMSTMDAFESQIRNELRAVAGLGDENEVTSCPACGEEQPDSFDYCSDCGADMNAEPEPEKEEVPAPAPATNGGAQTVAS